jgi:hypothetical protein
LANLNKVYRPLRANSTLAVGGAATLESTLAVTGLVTLTQALILTNATVGSAAANTFRISSKDFTSGNTMLSINSEGTSVATATPSANRTIAIDYNGSTYYLIASTSAS